MASEDQDVDEKQNPQTAFLEAYQALCHKHGYEIRGVPVITPEGRILVQLVPAAIQR